MVGISEPPLILQSTISHTPLTEPLGRNAPSDSTVGVARAEDGNFIHRSGYPRISGPTEKLPPLRGLGRWPT
jgi:hypothetical protein